MNKKGHIITALTPDSIAGELEIKPGDRLISINNKEIEDIFDYNYLIDDEYIEVEIEKSDGSQWIYEIEKDAQEDLGLEFENGLMDEYRSCTNKCIFCFIDQMPEGMRGTLYFKDDDSRLSFLQGNYITLTNMKDKQIKRIIDFHFEPVNISIHTTNPDLRCHMLSNRFAGKSLSYLKALYDAHISMNAQIVLCKGINDKIELEQTIKDLTGYIPYMKSLSVVPAGTTKFRDDLPLLESFTKEDAKEVINTIEKWQNTLYNKTGLHFVHASDEWYVLAEKDLPEEECYDGYLQLENGVGMLRLLIEEFNHALKEAEPADIRRTVSIATGVLAYPYICDLTQKVKSKFPQVKINVYPIINDFFGETITVSGLITGKDLMNQLKEKDLGDKLLLPINMLRSGEDVFLDDITVNELEKFLNIGITVVDTKGSDLLNAIIFDVRHPAGKKVSEVYSVLYDKEKGKNE